MASQPQAPSAPLRFPLRPADMEASSDSGSEGSWQARPASTRRAVSAGAFPGSADRRPFASFAALRAELGSAMEPPLYRAARVPVSLSRSPSCSRSSSCSLSEATPRPSAPSSPRGREFSTTVWWKRCLARERDVARAPEDVKEKPAERSDNPALMLLEAFLAFHSVYMLPLHLQCECESEVPAVQWATKQLAKRPGSKSYHGCTLVDGSWRRAAVADEPGAP